MKKIAIVTSIFLVLLVGWFIRMPRSTSVVVGDISTTDMIAPEVPTTGTAQPKPTTPKVQEPTQTVVTPPKPTTSQVPTTKYYTRTDVSAHATSSSCWTIVNGKVYDVTSWISRHPGGSSAIKRMCGTDGSGEFNDEHGGDRRPEQELAAFYIGVLKK